jgi:hypothetical protein
MKSREPKLETHSVGNIIRSEPEHPKGELQPARTAEELRMKREGDIPGSIDEAKRLPEEHCHRRVRGSRPCRRGRVPA